MPAQSFFHMFDLGISDPARGVFLETRVRLSRLFSEPMDRIFAKVLAFCHGYDPEIVFATGQDVTEPALFKKSLIGDYVDWIDIGSPSQKKLNKIIRSHTKPNIRLYFFRSGNQAEFAREYRGLDQEYAKRISIFEFDPNIILALGDEDSKHLKWSITFLEGSLYIDDGKRSFESSVAELNPIQILSKEYNSVESSHY